MGAAGGNNKNMTLQNILISGLIQQNHIQLTQVNMADFVTIRGDDVCPDITAPAGTTIFHRVRSETC